MRNIPQNNISPTEHCYGYEEYHAGCKAIPTKRYGYGAFGRPQSKSSLSFRNVRGGSRLHIESGLLRRLSLSLLLLLLLGKGWCGIEVLLFTISPPATSTICSSSTWDCPIVWPKATEELGMLAQWKPIIFTMIWGLCQGPSRWGHSPIL